MFTTERLTEILSKLDSVGIKDYEIVYTQNTSEWFDTNSGRGYLYHFGPQVSVFQRNPTKSDDKK